MTEDDPGDGRSLADIIADIGWAVLGVMPAPGSADVPFAYTIGLTATGRPELVIAGLDPRIMQTILNRTASRIIAGATIAHGDALADIIAGYDVIVIDGPIPDEPGAALRPAFAMNHYGADTVRIQQVVWPDSAHRFPWQDGYGVTDVDQPLITADNLPNYRHDPDGDATTDVEQAPTHRQSPTA